MMKFLIQALLPVISLVIFSISPVFAHVMISYEAKIYQLPEGDVADLTIDELIKNSELVHQPSLIVKPNEDAKIEIGIQDIQILEISLKSDPESKQYSASISQKQTQVDEIYTMSASIPNIDMGKEMHWRVSNARWRYFIIIKGKVVKQS